MKNYRNEVALSTKDIDFTNKKYSITLNTNMGAITFDLNSQAAPEHCQNLIGLARVGFYDNLKFHRVAKNYLIQTGCPLGVGTGGPGYKLNPEFSSAPHELGTVSMARTADVTSAGSQFFICLDRREELDQQYTVLGKVIHDDVELLKKLGTVQTGLGDRPMQDIFIENIEVQEQVQ